MQVFVAPPLYRKQPLWYNKNLALVATRFSSALTSTDPGNLHLLPSFLSQDLLPDGAFLSPVSGLHYMLHIFDQTQIILESLGSSAESQISRVSEAVRVHDDRLAYLENKNDDVKKRVSHKIATDSEFNDWQTNRSEEDWLTIMGFRRLSGDLSHRDWQVAIQKLVTEFLRAIVKAHRATVDFKVLYVQNPVQGRTTGMSVLNVQLDSVNASRRIRDMYSGFFRHNKPISLPASFKGVSVRNKVTLATRVRISILQQLGSNYKETNPGSQVNVIGYTPRPRLVTTPARGSSGRPRTYNFIDAVTTLPPVLSDNSLARVFQIVGSHYPGELRDLFVILDDDDRERCQALVRNQQRGPHQSAAAASASVGPSGAASGPTPAVSTFSGSFAQSGTGMELESGFLKALRAPPPPPPPGSPSSDRSVAKSPPRKSHSKSGHKSRKSHKSSKHKSKKSSKSRKSKKSSKRGLKRSRNSPPPGEKSRKRSRRSSSDSSSAASTSSGSSSSSGPSYDSGPSSGESPEH